MKAKTSHISFIPAIIWAILILYLSAGPSVQLPSTIWDLIGVDKIGHLVFYAILSFLITRGFHTGLKKINKKFLLIAFVISILYGISMEAMQYLFFPNRYFEFLDIIANIIGALLGIIFFKHILLKNR